VTTTITTTTTTISTTSTVADLGTDAEELIIKFNEAKRLMKAAEAAKKEVESILRERMGDAEVGQINGVDRVKISERSTTTVDRDTLKSAFPEAYEVCVGSTSYTILTTC
jgi:predicted phage-related endonuclease